MEREIKENHTFEKLIIDTGAQGVSAWNERTNSYKTAEFDIVMDPTITQGKVFDMTGISEIVKHVTEGYNATIFAYG